MLNTLPPEAETGNFVAHRRGVEEYIYVLRGRMRAKLGLRGARDVRIGPVRSAPSGLGRRFGLAPWTARILFVLLLMVVPGSQILIYPLLWILMPNEETDSTPEVTTPIATTI